MKPPLSEAREDRGTPETNSGILSSHNLASLVASQAGVPPKLVRHWLPAASRDEFRVVWRIRDEELAWSEVHEAQGFCFCLSRRTRSGLPGSHLTWQLLPETPASCETGPSCQVSERRECLSRLSGP